jgi:acyl-CoA hydrolase
VADIIPNGATIQFGIGGIPAATLSLLEGHRDIGIHSGMIGDSVINLVESNVVTGLKKTLDRGLIVTAEVIGTKALFEWVHRNPRLRMAPASYSHSTAIASQSASLVAIQGALEVGLDGAINAENLGEVQVSGCGGQPDFAEAAFVAEGGLGIHALPATSRNGQSSRIVRRVAAVTTPRFFADRVVTEFGVAILRGKSASHRAEALRAIAAEPFRDALR